MPAIMKELAENKQNVPQPTIGIPARPSKKEEDYEKEGTKG